MSFVYTWWLHIFFINCFTPIWGSLPFLTHSSSDGLKHVEPAISTLHTHGNSHPGSSSIVENVLSPHFALGTKQKQHMFGNSAGDLFFCTGEKVTIFQRFLVDLQWGVEVISMTSTSL